MHGDDEPAAVPAGGTGSGWRAHVVPGLVALLLAALVALALPAGWVVQAPVYPVGTVADDDIIAPFSFRVAKTDAELASDRAAAGGAVEPVYRRRPEVADSVTRRLAAVLAALDSTTTAEALAARANALGLRLTGADAQYLALRGQRAMMFGAVARVFERTLPGGVTVRAPLDDLTGMVRLLGGDGEVRVPANALATFDDVLARARRLHPDPGSATADALYLRLLRTFFRPTLLADSATTQRRRIDAVAGVSGDRLRVQQGERLVRAHDVVDDTTHAKLVELRAAQRLRAGGGQLVGRWIGAALAALLVLGFAGWLVRMQRPALYASPRAMGVLALALGSVLLTAGGIARLPTPHPELVPVAVATVVITLLAGVRIGVLAAMTLAILLGMQGEFQGTPTLAFAAVGGISAALAVRSVRKRSDAYGAMAVVAVAYALMALAVGLTREWGSARILATAAWGAANGLVSVALAFTILAPLEELSGVDTYLKLLEWSDLNRPLLRRLSLEAPGTFAHTVAVANLVEAACTAIGANGLLGRVGTYYHDIGKLVEPQYFVENQPKGRNPHDQLAPGASASIIRKHVRDGLALAESHGVPRSIRAFITEHHGTAPLSFFLEKARQRDAAGTAGAGPFSGEFAYPGPIPQSAETAICMLADGVEAVARSLADPTPARLRDVVEQMVATKLGQGQLRDTPLTLRQLEEVKAQFVRVLTGMYHSRVEYPMPVVASVPAREVS